jgi:uncharacterized membrane protein
MLLARYVLHALNRKVSGCAAKYGLLITKTGRIGALVGSVTGLDDRKMYRGT